MGDFGRKLNKITTGIEDLKDELRDADNRVEDAEHQVRKLEEAVSEVKNETGADDPGIPSHNNDKTLIDEEKEQVAVDLINRLSLEQLEEVQRNYCGR